MRLLLERFTCDRVGCDHFEEYPALPKGQANPLPAGWVGVFVKGNDDFPDSRLYCRLTCFNTSNEDRTMTRLRIPQLDDLIYNEDRRVDQVYSTFGYCVENKTWLVSNEDQDKLYEVRYDQMHPHEHNVAVWQQERTVWTATPENQDGEDAVRDWLNS